MVDYVALSVHSTSAYTRVSTFVKYTGLVSGTVCVDNTFGTANGVRVT